jgi:hypothetical protein
MGGARRAAKGRGGPRGAETSRATLATETLITTGAVRGTANELRTKTGVSAAIITSGRLGGAGAGCILQQHGEEIETSDEAALFAQQAEPTALCDDSSASCRAAIMGQAVLGDCIWQASTNRAGARKVVIRAKTSMKIVRLRNIGLLLVYPRWVSLAI